MGKGVVELRDRLGGSAQFKDRYSLNVDTNSIEFLIQIDFYHNNNGGLP